MLSEGDSPSVGMQDLGLCSSFSGPKEQPPLGPSLLSWGGGAQRGPGTLLGFVTAQRQSGQCFIIVVVVGVFQVSIYSGKYSKRNTLDSFASLSGLLNHTDCSWNHQGIALRTGH